MLLSALLLALPVPALAAPGDLDPSFDGDGRVLTDFRSGRFSGFDSVNALAVQPDGKVVATGESTLLDGANFALARYNRDGSLDRSFGGDGRVRTFGRPAIANALLVQSDGKLVAAGSTVEITDSPDFALACFNSDGSLDTSFGAGGLVLTDLGASDIANALVQQPDGKLVAAGRSSSIGGSDLVLVRFQRDGSLDTSFGSGGVVRTDFGASDTANALVLQLDGKLVTAGERLSNANGNVDRNLTLARFNPDGSLDGTFGDGGFVVFDVSEESQANALVLQRDGKLVTAGSQGTQISNSSDFALARFRPDGSLDTSFGTGGVVRTDFGASDTAYALVLQPDGKLIAAGSSRQNPPGQFSVSDSNFLLARYLADGSLDTSFGSGGSVRTGFGITFNGAVALVLEPSGKLVAGGHSGASSGCCPLSFDLDFALARYVTTNERLAVPPKCGGRRVTILGTSRKDTLRGTFGPDVILGLAGNDTIRGFAGNDTICGGKGRDTLIGNDGKDRLLGEDGDDKLFGDKGRDSLDGGSGRDACRTGETAQRCEGKPASSKPTSGERPKDPPRPPCPPVASFPCS